MKDALNILVNRYRKADVKVTNKNKDKLIREINRNSKEFVTQEGRPLFGKLSKDASIEQVRATKKLYLERLNYDVLSTAIREGNTTIASVYGKDLKKSKDKEYKLLGEYAEKLASAKKRSDSKLTKEEKQFLDKGNQAIKGYGNEDIFILFENAKSRKGIENLIKEIANQDPKQIFYDKQLETFERVFQKVEVFREDDINKLKEHLRSLDFNSMNTQSLNLLESLEIYGSPTQLGAWEDETELANARLDDILIKTGIKKGGHKKVQTILNKYRNSNT